LNKTSETTQLRQMLCNCALRKGGIAARVNLGGDSLLGAQMGLISTFPALGPQPSKAVISSALGTEAALPNSGLPIRISQTTPVRPITASANSEAIVRDHIGAQGEVDGVKLDMIPFIGDGAILLDDVPEAEPEPPPPPRQEAIASLPTTVVQIKATSIGHEVDDAGKTDAAEKAYQDEREVSHLPKDAIPAKFDTIDHQSDPAKPDQSPAPPLDMVM
jgi:hypothetical protein